jgi:hypothetical protein
MKNTYKINLVKNKSLTYMLPLIDSEIDLEFNQFLLNCYTSFGEADETFCIMYNWSSTPDFLKYEGKLMSHPMYIGHADFGNKVVYKFKLTHLMKRERDLFVQGRYKEFSNSHKEAILEYMKKMGYNNVTKIGKIISQQDSIKSDPPDMKLETVSVQVSKLIINVDSPFSDNIPEVKSEVVRGFGNL